jgi:23S rRNA (guanosine2251-2'-O)-methyltransferase
MVHRRVKRTRTSKSLGSHNRAWIWGRHVVAETLTAGRWPILELGVSDKLAETDRWDLLHRAKAAGIAILETDDAGLTKLCRAADHQGCAARMGEFPYLTDEQFLQQLAADSVILMLDRIQDPFNFGAMIRTAEGLGINGIVIGVVEQTGVNSQVARSSAGAVNHVPIARVDDLSAFAQQLRQRHWQLWGASERGASSIEEADFRPPLALVIGNEGTGIQPELLQTCTNTVKIPMRGQVGSLNAAVSAGILSYEAMRRRRSTGT